jgi:phage anti-repressor protein
MEMKNKGMPERDGKGKRSREMWRVRVDQQMEMKNKGMPERDGKGKRSREMWRVRVDHGK